MTDAFTIQGVTLRLTGRSSRCPIRGRVFPAIVVRVRNIHPRFGVIASRLIGCSLPWGLIAGVESSSVVDMCDRLIWLWVKEPV